MIHNVFGIAAMPAERAATHAANGHEIVRYRITPKGRAAWDAYRFTEDPPPEAGTE